MSNKVVIVAGTTTALEFQLLEGGSAINLTGITVELLLTDKDGTSVTTTGDVSVTGASTGTVTYTPDSADLDATKSPYKARWKLTDGSGNISYVPTGLRDEWSIVKE